MWIRHIVLVTFSLLCRRQRMRFVVGLFEALGGDVGVDLGGAEVLVAE